MEKTFKRYTHDSDTQESRDGQTGTALVIAPNGDMGTTEAATQHSPSQPIPGPPEWIELTEALGRAAATRVDGGT